MNSTPGKWAKGVATLLALVAAASALAAETTNLALVRHALSVNGTIDGSVLQTTAEGMTLNGGGVVTGDLLVPGTPTVRLNGHPTYGGTVDGAGNASPSTYQITLNGSCSLRHVIRRIDPVDLPTVSAPPYPAGTRNVTITNPGGNPGDFSTLRNLILNGNVGQYAVPPGTYGDFTANGGSGFILGIAGSTQPAIYNFQHLTLNGQTQLQVVGPVIIAVAYGFTANGSLGSSPHPAWLTLNVYSGGFTLNGGCAVNGFVSAPNGTVIVNGNSQLLGGLSCDRLILNGGGLLRLVASATENHPPVANDQTATLNEDTPTLLTLGATDPDGDSLAYIVVGSPAHGTLSGAAANLTYAPAPDYNGPDSFTFKANDGQVDSNVATVRLTVTPVNDAPVADAKNVILAEDTSADITLTGTDVDGDALTFSVTVPPTHGTLSGAGASLIYTPDANYNGLDSFAYIASDGSLNSTPATAAITVTPVNDPPEAISQRLTVNEGENLPITLSGSDIDGDALSFIVLSQPSHGILSGAAPHLSYHPNNNYGGPDSFAFKANDGTVDSAPSTITIQVTNLNDPPVADSQSLTTPEDTPTAITLTGSDPDGDAITFIVVTPPTHGSLSGTGSNLTYTPAENYNGPDRFTFKTHDAEVDSTIATVSIEVTPVNDAPAANGQSITTDEDTAVPITLTASDVEANALTYTIVTPPTHGTLSGSPPGLTYTPAANYYGSDSFTFKANDGELDSPPAAIEISVKPVNDAPTAAPQSVSTAEDTPVAIELAGTDVEGSALTFTILTPPARGTLTGTAPSLLFTPALNYNGDDSFTFRVNDGELDSEPATVALTVTPVNDPPVASGQSVSIQENGVATLTLAGSDPDGDPLTFMVVTPPAHGTLSGSAPNLTYTPAANFSGADSFTYKVTDGTLESAPATVSISIAEVNDPPVANSQSVVTAEDTALPVTLSANDPEGDALAYIITTPPAHGALSGTAPNLIYTPAPDYHGPDSFVFKANDGQLDSGEATVTISVTAVNDAPTAEAASVVTEEDTAKAITLTGSDPDGDAITFIVVTPPAHGTLSGVAPNLTYTPAENYNGPDSFAYKTNDGTLDSNIATVAITVTPVNDAPVAEPLALSVFSNGTASFTLSATDVDGDALTFIIVTPPAHGVLSGMAPHLTYTPAQGYAGADSFTFKARDGTLESEPATASITIGVPPNLPPVVNAGPDAYAAYAPSAAIKPYSNIVLNHDEWTLTDTGFTASSASATRFAQNVAHWITGGKPGKFLAYTKCVPGSVDFAYTGVSLRQAMEADGHTWVTSSTIPFTLENLIEYDAVFLAANQVDNQVLIDYVNAGGTVYISAGTKWSGTDADIEAGWYNTFLNHFGLAYGYPYNGVRGTLPVESTHPIFAGITSLYYDNGNPVIVLNPEDPRTSVINTYQGKALMALYSKSGEAATITLSGSVTDDGLPGGSTLQIAWSKVSGPDLVYFDNPSSPATTATFSAPGTYTLRLTATDGAATATDDVVITVERNDPPQVYAGPDQTARSVSDPITLQGMAMDDGLPRDRNLTITWEQVAGPGPATFSAPHAVTTGVTVPLSGIYVFRLKANDGQLEASDLVEVRVGALTAATPAGLVAWWPGNGTPADTVTGSNARLLGGTTYADGQVSLGFSFDGVNDYASVTASPSLNLGSSAEGFTIELWVKPAEFRDTPLVQWATAATEGVSLRMWNSGRGLTAFLRDTNNQDHTIEVYNQFQTGVWQHVAVTYDRSTGLARQYRNGTIILQQNLGIFTPQTTYDVYFGTLQRENRYFKGVLDEISFYRRPLSPAEVYAVYSADGTGKCPIGTGAAPVVNAGPDLVLPGATEVAVLNGTVTDDGLPLPVRVQWQKLDGPGNVSFGDPSLAQTTATFSVPGTYVLQLSADDGLNRTSATARIRVGVRYAFDSLFGLAAWWPGNANPIEVVHGNHDVQFFNGATYGSGCVSMGFLFDGANDYDFVPAHTDFDIGASAQGFTIELWVKPDEFRDTPLVQWATSTTEGVSLRMWNNGRGLYAFIRDTNNQDHTIGIDNQFQTGVWQHVAVTYDRSTGLARLYKNGLVIAQQNLGIFTPRTSYDLYFGTLVRESRYFKGVLDEITLYTRPLTPAEMLAVYQADGVGKSPMDSNAAPVVNAGPDLVLPNLTDTATLNGTATDDGGPAPLIVAWSKLDGPGTVTFANPAAATTTATFSAPGIYVLQLDADDGLNRARPDTTVVRVGIRYAFHDLPGLAAWWPGNAKPVEVVHGNHDVQFINGTTYGLGNVSMGFLFHGASDYDFVPAHTDFDLGASAQGLTIELWVKPDEFRDTPLVQWATSTTEGVSLRMWNSGRGLTAFLRDTNNQDHTIEVYNQFQTGVWQHVAVTYDRGTGLARLYRNGLIIAQQNLGIFTPRTSYDLYFGTLVRESRYFKGVLDEITLYTRPLTPAEMLAIYQADGLGKSPVDNNAAPVVNAGPDLVLPNLTDTATLAGSATDDGGPAPLTIAWSKLDGPGTVTFANPAAATTSAIFSAPGIYVLQLDADDGLNRARPDTTVVRVATAGAVSSPPDLAAWWPGNATPAELVNGHDAQLINGLGFGPGKVSMGFVFDGVNDYGQVAAHSDINLGASAQGFTVELWVKPDEFRDTPLVQWATSTTEGVSLRMWNNGRGLYAFIRDTNNQDHTIGIDNQFQSGVWQHVAVTYDRGTGAARLFKNGTAVIQQTLGIFTPQTTYDIYFGSLLRESRWFKGTLDEITFYSRPLSANEVLAVYQAGANGKLPPVINQAPVVNAGLDQTAFVGMAITLAGTATDDGLPNPPAALTYQWSKVSGPGLVTLGSPASLTTIATFDTVGTYVLRLSASDSVLTGTDDVTIIVTTPPSNPPTVSITDPHSGENLPANTPFAITATATDSDGTIAKVEFFQGAAKLGETTAPRPGQPSTFDFGLSSGLPIGSYTFTAKATDNTGMTATSAPVSVTVVADPGTPPVAAISTPAEDARISAPTTVTGVVASPILASWALECRLKAADGETPAAWTTIATGTSNIGTPPQPPSSTSTPGALGTFDPTLLLNGIYELRLRATDGAGRSLIDGPITVVVEGNMKVGAFTLAFEDLSLPLAGIPIQVIRTYDSRDSRTGDFGPGWRIAVNNIRLQKNRNLGQNWFQTLQSGTGIQFYCVDPEREPIVTVTFPDGQAHRFRAGAYVKNRPGDPDDASFAVVVRSGKVKFYPLGDTTSTLEPLDATNQLADTFWIAGTGEYDITTDDMGFDVFNPTRFRLTTKDGAVYILDERLGLLEMHDLNGNTLVLNRDAQNRTNSVVATQNTSGAPIVHTVTLHRDGTGRVDYIRDLAGHDLDYIYDEQGRLSSFANRELNLTQFRYENAAFPYYLTKIIDPRGITALRSEYDASGRLVKQIDAAGKETIFNRGIDATGRFEKVKDRLGNETAYYYDERGNVVQKIDPLGGVTSYTYDANDNQTSVIDPLGHTSTTTYDAKKNILTQSDPLGNTTTFTYDDLSLPLSITDPRGKVTTNEYSASGNLTRTTDPAGAVTEIAYDSAGRLTQTKDALNQVATNTYGPDGRLASTTNVLGHTTSWTNDANGNRLTQTVTRTQADGSTVNETTSYLYDAENRLTKTTFPDGTFTEATYNAIGKQAATRDQLGRVTSYTYDVRGNLVRTDHPDGTFETTAYDLENRVTAATDRTGHATATTYDALGRAIRVTAADGSYTQTDYDAAGRVTLTTDALGNATAYSYDNAGRRTSVTDALNQTTTYAFDAAGNMVSFIDALNHTTSYTYDDRGQRTLVTFPDSTTQATAYDALGRKTVTTDQEGKVTRYRYDALGRLVEVRQYLDAATAVSDSDYSLPATHSSLLATRYSYDELGDQISQTDALGRITRFEYDSLGRRVKRILPDGAGEICAYDAAGNLTARTDFTGRTTTFVYDALNRLTAKSADPSHPSLVYGHATARIEYDYDANGARIAARTFNSGNTQLYSETTPRDQLGRVTGKATALGTLSYEYYANSLLKDVVSSNNGGVNTGYRYDALSRLAFVDDASGVQPVGTPVRITAYTYTANGSLETVTAANGVKHGYAYDTLNRLTSISVADVSAQVLRSYGYTLRASGHRQQVTENTGRTVSYAYDGIYRLTGETIAGDPAGQNGSVSYTLDKVGNRLSRSSSVASVPSVVNTFTSRDWVNSDTYDANGNTTLSSGVTTQDIYDFEDRLIVRQKPDGSTINLSYDADGNRIQKTLLAPDSSLLATTYYLVDSNNLTGYAQVVEEYRNTATGTTAVVYTYGSDLISQAVSVNSQTSAHCYFGYDGLGSVRFLTDASGVVTDTWDYDAFGNLVFKSGSTSNNYLYAGEQYDADLGLYYNRARYLNTDSGRFWNADSFEGFKANPQSLHRYLYANANPANGRDPTGRFSLGEVMETVGTVGLLTTIANVGITALGFAAFSNADSEIPDAGVISVGESLNAAGGSFSAGFDLVWMRKTGKWFVYPGVAAGLNPLSLFKKYNGSTNPSFTFGAIWNLQSPGEWAGRGLTATWPMSIIHLLPKALFNGNKMWGAITQLAKYEKNVDVSNRVVQIGLSTSGPVALKGGVRSNQFTAEATYAFDAIPLEQLQDTLAGVLAALPLGRVQAAASDITEIAR